MKCLNCNSEMKNTDKYCGICGTPNPNFNNTAISESGSSVKLIKDNSEDAQTPSPDVTAQPPTPLPVVPAQSPTPPPVAPTQPQTPPPTAPMQSPSPQPQEDNLEQSQEKGREQDKEKPQKEKRTAPLWLCILCIIIIFILSIICGALIQVHFGTEQAKLNFVEKILRILIW